jgi:hypothetical protein
MTLVKWPARASKAVHHRSSEVMVRDKQIVDLSEDLQRRRTGRDNPSE